MVRIDIYPGSYQRKDSGTVTIAMHDNHAEPVMPLVSAPLPLWVAVGEVEVPSPCTEVADELKLDDENRGTTVALPANDELEEMAEDVGEGEGVPLDALVMAGLLVPEEVVNVPLLIDDDEGEEEVGEDDGLRMADIGPRVILNCGLVLDAVPKTVRMWSEQAIDIIDDIAHSRTII